MANEDEQDNEAVEVAPPADIDGAWKEAFQNYLEPFFALCLPEIHREIDWSRGFEFLDKELAQIAPESETGRRFVDLLVRVYRHGGAEQWVLVHIEVQAQSDAAFPRRMFVYHYRIFDRYNVPVASLAVLADDKPGWRPDHLAYDLWGCGVTFRYPVVKLTDYLAREAELEKDDNPFAVVILAHLKAMETIGDARRRTVWKLRLAKGLYSRGWNADRIRGLFRIIDWMVKLPKNLEIRFRDDIDSFEREKQMPYITSIERLAIEEGEARGEARGERHGLLAGIALAMKVKFGDSGADLAREVARVSDLPKLRQIMTAIERCDLLDDVRKTISDSYA